jgi:two-component system, NarL family, nitrate/nitrite response regulator NarL
MMFGPESPSSWPQPRMPRDAARGSQATVLVVDDHALFGQSLAFALRLQGLAAIGHAEGRLNAEQLTERIRREDVAVVILALPLADDAGGFQLVEACTVTRVRVLVVAGSHHHEIEAGALTAGADAVLDRARPFDDLAGELFSLITSGGATDHAQSRTSSTPLAAVAPRKTPRRTALDSLSPREGEVLRSLMDGKTVDEFAGGAALSVATVRSHVRAILTKLDVNCQLAAVAAAHREGWTADYRDGGSHLVDGS